MQSFSFDKIMWQKGIKPPPLCFATQNIGEVSRSDGGVKPYNQKLLCYLFQPLSEETGMCVPTRDLSLKFMLTPRIFY